MQKLPTSLPWQWLPPLVILTLVLTLHIDVPYHDQWDLLPLLHQHYQGTLQWQDLLQPHNGHILLLPKIVMLGLAVLTHWNTTAEVLFSFVCMLANWFLLQVISRTLLERDLFVIEKTALSLLVFSVSQAQNWIWGWQLQIPLALFFVLSGFCSLLCIRKDFFAMLAAAICGIAATFSFAGSLPFWIAAIPLLWQRRPILLAIWLGIAGICLATYSSIVQLTELPSATAGLIDTTELIRHTKNTLALLGNLIARFDMFASTIAGLTAIAIISFQYPDLSAKQKSLTLSLLLFSTGSALLVSLSRAGLGDTQMLASRYGTLTLPVWAVITMLLAKKIHKPYKSTCSIAGAGLLACLLFCNVYSFRDFEQMHRRLQRGSIALSQPDNAEIKNRIMVINPRQDQEQAAQEVKLLQQYQLSFYRKNR